MRNRSFVIVTLVLIAFAGSIAAGIVAPEVAEGKTLDDLGAWWQKAREFLTKPLFPLVPAPSPKAEEKKDGAAPAPSATPPAALTPRAPEKPPAALYKPVLDYEELVIKAVEKASPSVISIVITKDLPVLEQCPYDPFGDVFGGDDFFGGGGFKFYRPCDTGKREEKKVGGGSGFIASSDGLIVTNKHVVQDESATYTVLTNDGKKYAAAVLARDAARDLAILKIEAAGLPVLALGNSDALKLGQSVIAIGNALGEYRNTVSVGVVSGLGRTVTASGGGGFRETITGVIQTDAAINPGNSGGPLLNLRGEVIGINTAVASNAQNIGFAIPINQIKNSLASFRATGRIVAPYLGVRYALLEVGAKIVSETEEPAVMPNSPAAKAGLREGDIVTAVDGKAVGKDAPLADMIQKYSVGDRVTLHVKRGEESLLVTVTLEERP